MCSEAARDLLTDLLKRDLSKVNSKRNSESIVSNSFICSFSLFSKTKSYSQRLIDPVKMRSYTFFDDIDWEKLHAKEIDVPYIPPVVCVAVAVAVAVLRKFLVRHSYCIFALNLLFGHRVASRTSTISTLRLSRKKQISTWEMMMKKMTMARLRMAIFLDSHSSKVPNCATDRTPNSCVWCARPLHGRLNQNMSFHSRNSRNNRGVCCFCWQFDSSVSLAVRCVGRA